MIFAKMNEEDLKLLAGELKSAQDAKWYRRLKIIQLSSPGGTVMKLSNTFDVCKATVRDYINRYNGGGLKSLKRRNSDGRPTKMMMTAMGKMNGRELGKLWLKDMAALLTKES